MVEIRNISVLCLRREGNAKSKVRSERLELKSLNLQ
jgi:hypothetical protein